MSEAKRVCDQPFSRHTLRRHVISLASFLRQRYFSRQRYYQCQRRALPGLRNRDLLGLDHERLTYRYGGRDFRLTDVYGRVVQAILA
jgi:hypothetical protein